ncbi:MAG: 7-carboxy-7-deazaguanine synthase QueE [Sulfurimonas sp.]|nr:7-carboxy-7-deazaguanine synthase QueE [Sulfurimonas sp.]
MIYLVEHFYSIQGEGKYVGSPSLFFRFGGCNMTCVGFGCQEIAHDGTKILGCDTIYAVDKKHFSQNWTKIQTTKELLNILDSYKFPFSVDIVLTGGEPLIYANEKIFIEFLNEAHNRGYKIFFETNGSINVDFDKYPIFKECIFALSIKLKNSNEPLKKRINKDIIKSLISNSKEAFFKFVIDEKSIGSELEDEINSILAYAPKTKVYCMPMGANKLEVEKNSEALVEFCKAKGYNFSDRLHMRIWDKQKGI